MQRIITSEYDKSRNFVVSMKNVGAAFIPGFANLNIDNGGTSTPAPVGKCVECTSELEFKYYFGKTAPKFTSPLYFPYRDPGTISPAIIADTKAKLLEACPLDTLAFSTESTYAIGDKCIYKGTTSALYTCTTAIETPGAWDSTKWQKVIADNEIAKVTEDETSVDRDTTFYRYSVLINKNVATGSFTLLSISDLGFSEISIPTPESGGSYGSVIMYDQNTEDPSWNMAVELLRAGFPIVYCRVNETTADVTVKKMYTYLATKAYIISDTNGLLDKDLNIAFVTSGGYPTLEYSVDISKLMINACTYISPATKKDGRGDCVALLDHTDKPDRDLTGTNSVFEHTGSVPESSFASVFTPWCETSISSLPVAAPSFVYLYTVANNMTSANIWNIFAGVSRGRCTFVTGLHTNQTLTNKIAEYYQNQFKAPAEHCSINPITYIRNYGYCIWGNRTCEKYVSENEGFSLAFLNVRNMVNAVKKQVFDVSLSLMFLNNDEALWADFRARVSVLLDKMKSDGALRSYTYTKNISDDLTKLNATITLYPMYGVESMQILTEIDNDLAVSVEETE